MTWLGGARQSKLIPRRMDTIGTAAGTGRQRGALGSLHFVASISDRVDRPSRSLVIAIQCSLASAERTVWGRKVPKPGDAWCCGEMRREVRPLSRVAYFRTAVSRAFPQFREDRPGGATAGPRVSQGRNGRARRGHVWGRGACTSDHQRLVATRARPVVHVCTWPSHGRHNSTTLFSQVRTDGPPLGHVPSTNSGASAGRNGRASAGPLSDELWPSGNEWCSAPQAGVMGSFHSGPPLSLECPKRCIHRSCLVRAMSGSTRAFVVWGDLVRNPFPHWQCGGQGFESP